MAKKVLIISSSPRKGGNSDLLCDEFMKGAIEAKDLNMYSMCWKTLVPACLLL